MGVEARCRPSKSAAHCRHMKRQPCLCHGPPCHGRLLCHCRRHLRLRLHCHCHHRRRCNHPLPSPLPWAIAAVAVKHCRRHLCRVAVSHCCRCHPCHRALPFRHCWPSQLPLLLAITVAMPSAISKSCCLGAARIVFDQSKQRMFTLFYFVGIVGGVLIEARSLTRCQAAMANTSVGRQAASSERLVRELACGWGAAGSEGWRC